MDHLTHVKDGGLMDRYALISAQGKGQPKYVRMRGQQVEEVLTKTEYTAAVSHSDCGESMSDGSSWPGNGCRAPP